MTVPPLSESTGVQRQPANEWWREWMNIVRLVRFLTYTGELLTAASVIEVIEKPWHWEREFEAMTRFYANEDAA